MSDGVLACINVSGLRAQSLAKMDRARRGPHKERGAEHHIFGQASATPDRVTPSVIHLRRPHARPWRSACRYCCSGRHAHLPAYLMVEVAALAQHRPGDKCAKSHCARLAAMISPADGRSCGRRPTPGFGNRKVRAARSCRLDDNISLEVTGPTLTNVNDFRAVLIEPS